MTWWVSFPDASLKLGIFNKHLPRQDSYSTNHCRFFSTTSKFVDLPSVFTVTLYGIEHGAQKSILIVVTMRFCCLQRKGKRLPVTTDRTPLLSGPTHCEGSPLRAFLRSLRQSTSSTNISPRVDQILGNTVLGSLGVTGARRHEDEKLRPPYVA